MVGAGLSERASRFVAVNNIGRMGGSDAVVVLVLVCLDRWQDCLRKHCDKVVESVDIHSEERERITRPGNDNGNVNQRTHREVTREVSLCMALVKEEHSSELYHVCC